MNLSPIRWGIVTFVAWIMFVGAVIGVSQYLSHRDVRSVTAQSNVNICIAGNKAHDGVEKLVAKLVKATHDSTVLDEAVKRERIAGYESLLAYFPALDCRASPIVFK